MPKVQVVTLENDPIVTAPSHKPGTSETRAVFEGERDPLHLRIERLGPNASLRLDGSEADQVAFVWKGAARAGGTRLEEHASMIVEKDAAASLTASDEGATILLFSMNGRPTHPRPGGHVHLLPSEQVPRTLDMGGRGVAGGALHADAGCPTCEIWLHENQFYHADYEVGIHSHTEDELIFVTAGSIRLGNRLYGTGTTLAVAANTKYGFKAGPQGLTFVNFRASAPSYLQPGSPHAQDEAELWRNRVGAPEYLELAAD